MHEISSLYGKFAMRARFFQTRSHDIFAEFHTVAHTLHTAMLMRVIKNCGLPGALYAVT